MTVCQQDFRELDTWGRGDLLDNADFEIDKKNVHHWACLSILLSPREREMLCPAWEGKKR